MKKTKDEWRKALTPRAYQVTREQGTERPFTGILNGETRVGTYGCVCCGQVLFQSDAKFNAGCGWPSFFQFAEGAAILEIEDLSHGMRRIEVRCGGCDAHLGHVFPDGPPPTGLRYCINSVSLQFTTMRGDVVIDSA